MYSIFRRYGNCSSEINHSWQPGIVAVFPNVFFLVAILREGADSSWDDAIHVTRRLQTPRDDLRTP